MKKIVFTLITVFALAFGANSVKAQNETSVIVGGTYTYKLEGVSSVNAATATVDYTGDNEDITEISGSYTIAAGTVNGDVEFTVLYGSQGSPATSGNIVVEITDDVTGCKNKITLAITVNPAPIINLAMTATEDQYCQTTLTTTNNVAASFESPNTLTFTISKDVTNAPASYTWGYTITLPNSADGLNAFVVKRNGVVTAPGTFSGLAATDTEVWTVEFQTSTNLDEQNITATLSAVKLTDTTSAGGVYDETDTSDNADTVDVLSMPAIGKFN